MIIPTWKRGTYAPGTLVVHNGEAYIKLDDDDQTAPDRINGGWELIENSNIEEYNTIATSLSGYEERAQKHKAETLAKLQAAGLSPEEVKVVLAS